MLITELCKKRGQKSEQYFILLFSFQASFITLAGTELTASAPHLLLWILSHVPLCLHSLQFSHTTTAENAGLS